MATDNSVRLFPGRNTGHSEMESTDRTYEEAARSRFTEPILNVAGDEVFGMGKRKVRNQLDEFPVGTVLPKTT